jgi:hypothetical protein
LRNCRRIDRHVSCYLVGSGAHVQLRIPEQRHEPKIHV